MLELDSFDKQAYRDGALDVVVDAARFAFLQTLRSPTLTSPKMSFEPYRRTDYKSRTPPRTGHSGTSPRPPTMCKTPPKERRSDASLESEEAKETKHKKRKSRLSFSTLRSLFNCFKPPEDKPIPRKRPKFKHRNTSSGQVILASRRRPVDSSTHRYHRRQDFMRSMLESQLETHSP